jgi:hypothetical protein
MRENLDALTGKTINRLSINTAKDVIKVEFAGGGARFLCAVGDCCSRSWFEHIGGLDALIGHTIHAVDAREMPPLKEEENPDTFVQYYGWRFTTWRGYADLEMRNESNGYYGGWVEVVPGPVNQYSIKVEMPELMPLVEDF